MCEDGLKKRYKSIPLEDRLPVGTLESDSTENPSQDEGRNYLSGIKEHDEYQDNISFEVPQFYPVLIPIEESFPSAVHSNDAIQLRKSNETIVKARQERNDALLLAKHYRRM